MTIDMALLTGDKHSLAVEEIYADNDDSSGFSLHASVHSCDSSVTWYEGSDIREISIDDDSSIVHADKIDEIMSMISGGELLSTYS